MLYKIDHWTKRTLPLIIHFFMHSFLHILCRYTYTWPSICPGQVAFINRCSQWTSGSRPFCTFICCKNAIVFRIRRILWFFIGRENCHKSVLVGVLQISRSASSVLSTNHKFTENLLLVLILTHIRCRHVGSIQYTYNWYSFRHTK